MGAKNQVEIYLFGGMSVRIGDKIVLSNDDRLKNHWKLLAFLVLNKNRPITNQMLMNTLYADENVKNPRNALKNTVYSLRRDMGNKEDFILAVGGDYRWNSQVDLFLDTEVFEQNCIDMKKTEDVDVKIKLFKQILELYKENLLSQIEDEQWVLHLAIYYRKLYLDVLYDYLEILMEREEYSELLLVTEKSSYIEPFEDKLYLYMFKALAALNLSGIITDTYKKINQMFYNELGTEMCTEIKMIYLEANRKINNIERDIDIIKEDLKEVTKGQVPIRGAYFCSYETFKEIYQITARVADRYKRVISILLLTLTSEDNEVPSERILENIMEHLKIVIKGSLRKGDIFAKYSKSQYIIMIAMGQEEKEGVIIQRIDEHFSEYRKRNGIKLLANSSLQDSIT